MILRFFFFALFLTLMACSDDDSSDDDLAFLLLSDPEPTGPATFTDVAGTYSFETTAFSYECSDGSADTLAPTAFNILVEQDGNELTYTNTDFLDDDPTNDGFTGAVLVETSGSSGLIRTNNTFILNNSAIFEFDDPEIGTATTQYSITGTFGSFEWYGEYNMSVYFNDLFISCDYVADFSGVKLD